ncbi:MAG: FAD-dependent oxidoreductase [Acidobacteria bacterium]|nr:FAD-dependent oxidoreductase [Acidobacteriota bacterium]
MPAERLVVIGGVAAGMSAASRARRLNPRMEIVVLEKGDYVSYGTCGLTYLVSGVVRRPEDLIVYTPEFFRRERDVDVRTGHEVVEIVPGKKEVEVRAADSTYALKYDKLVLAAGGAPATSIPGVERPCVFTCNDLRGALALRDFLLARRPRRGVVIGGGYIGLEAAEALRAHDVDVTVLERSDTLLEGLEPEIGFWVNERLARHGIRAILNAAVNCVEPGLDESVQVVYGPRQELTAEVVVLTTGVAPRVELAARAGVELGSTGAIRTDDRQQTNLPSVYAAGDCAETTHLVTGGPVYVPLGTTANKQGRVAGENAAGGNARFPGVVGTLVTKVFGLEVAKTGLSQEAARAAGFSAEAVTIEARSRARYLGGQPLRATLVVDRESGRLLGGQLAGEEGAARRIDVLATALAARMTLSDFVHLDLGYAPPFGPVYDPLLTAAWEALKKIGRRR